MGETQVVALGQEPPSVSIGLAANPFQGSEGGSPLEAMDGLLSPPRRSPKRAPLEIFDERGGERRKEGSLIRVIELLSLSARLRPQISMSGPSYLEMESTCVDAEEIPSSYWAPADVCVPPRWDMSMIAAAVDGGGDESA